MNYFELFDFPVAPVVDKKSLSERYFALQRQNHPDFFTQSNEAEQQSSLEHSAAINKAFTTFQNDDKTIEYFLEVKGMLEKDEKYQLPPDFLMEMMEINETLDEKDGVEISGELAAIEKQLYAAVEPILESASMQQDAQALEQLKMYYYKKKYIQRILARLGD